MVTSLTEFADEGWAELLGCDVALLHRPGVHLVPGNDQLHAWEGIFMARVVEAAVLVYGPEADVPRLVPLLEGVSAAAAFRTDFVARLAGKGRPLMLGPYRYAFVDIAHFRPAEHPAGSPLPPDDPELEELRAACGEDDWDESGLADTARAPHYGIKSDGQLLAAGNLGPYRSRRADVGVLVHPAYRGRGLARRLVSRMAAEVLPEVGVLRYSAAQTNTASLAVAEALGFMPRGEQVAVRLV